MRNIVLIAAVGVVALGCARIRVEAPKEAIKLDVSMRLDIYQHIQNDIDDIENMVSGSGKKAAKGTHSLLDLIITEAHAEDGLSADVQEAVGRRKDRRDNLLALEEVGTMGENRLGLVEVRKTDGAAQMLADAENGDRMKIYNAVAEKNGSSLSQVQKLYAKRLQGDAPAGTPIELESGWINK